MYNNIMKVNELLHATKRRINVELFMIFLVQRTTFQLIRVSEADLEGKQNFYRRVF